MLCAEWENTNETVQASDQAVYHLGFDPDRGTIDPDRALCLYIRWKRGTYPAFHMGEFWEISGNYLFKCDPEIFSPGHPDNIDLSCMRISPGIHYFKIFRKGAKLSHTDGYDPHVDQHASAYLCMDEHSF